MNNISNHDNNHDMARVAAAVSIVGDPPAEWTSPGIFSQPLLFKASAILAVSGVIAGILSILYARHMIGVTEKDFLVGSYYAIMFGGALRLSGKLDAKRAAMLIASVIVFQTWNTLFFHTPLAVVVVALGLWLPLYWMWTDPDTMKELGLVKKGIPVYFLTGLMMAAALVSYFAWGMKNFGFTFKIEPWRLIVNSAQVLPMYISIFCFLFMVWNRLKSIGLSPIAMLLALAILSASLNAPVFILVGKATGTPLFISLAGFASITGVMALSTHLTFGRFRSALPAACLFTAMSTLLLLTGLV
jgi:hypothetical protein